MKNNKTGFVFKNKHTNKYLIWVEMFPEWSADTLEQAVVEDDINQVVIDLMFLNGSGYSANDYQLLYVDNNTINCVIDLDKITFMFA